MHPFLQRYSLHICFYLSLCPYIAGINVTLQTFVYLSNNYISNICIRLSHFVCDYLNAFINMIYFNSHINIGLTTDLYHLYYRSMGLTCSNHNLLKVQQKSMGGPDKYMVFLWHDFT